MTDFSKYYITGKSIKIKKLRADHLGTKINEIPLTITNVEIYNFATKKEISNPQSPSKPSNQKLDKKTIPINETNISTSSPSFYILNKTTKIYEFIQSNKKDYEPSINIDLKQSYNIYSIVITIKDKTMANILNTMVEVLDEQNRRVFFKIISKNDVKGNTITLFMYCESKCKILGCNDDCPVCAYKSKEDCPKQTKCNSFLFNGDNSYLENIMEQYNKTLSVHIPDTITEINNLLYNISEKQSDDFKKIMTDVNKNIEDLRNMNVPLADAVSSLGALPKIIQIIPPNTTSENFTNYNYKGDNLNLNMMSINSNDVSQFNRNVKSNKDKQIEKFANFVQPKINVYEGFNSWQSDTTLNSRIPYQTPSSALDTTITPANRVSNIPIVKNQNIENNLNNYTAKILAMNIKNKADKLNASWIKNN